MIITRWFTNPDFAGLAIYGLATLAASAFRALPGLNQIQLNERVGIEKPHLSRLESGKTEPGLYMLELLANGLGVTISELVRDV